MSTTIRVLHVDDDPDFADLTATSLEGVDARFDVDTVTSATDGLDRLDDSVDCVLSDYEMPGMDGITFLAAVREDYPDLPFILYTGRGNREVASEAISAGVTDYVRKQTSPEQYELLATRITTAVGQYRAEQELERQADLFGKTQDLADIGAWEYDRQEEEAYFTDKVYEIYGVDSDYEPDPERDIQRFYHPEDRDTVRGAVERALESGEAYDIEVRITAADGTEKWVRTRSSPHPSDGDHRWFRGTIQDITDRKTRERELETVKRQYQTLVENFPDGGVFLFDADLEYVQAGGSELAALGLTPDDFEGSTPHDLFPEAVADETARYYRVALDGESNTFEQEYEGEKYRVQTVPVRTDTEEVVYGMAVSRRITEQAERRRELERQNERLEEFAGLVSHDLRNPLSVAVARLDLARRECESPYLDDVARAHDRMDALIDDLLTLAREGGRVSGIEEVALEELSERCWRAIETADATLVVESGGTVEADPGQLQQLFENLYQNAVEHGGEGVTVTVGETTDGFYVADTGTGIPESQRDRVFEAGYSTERDGTGFGLQVVKQVVDAHGWEVAVTESEAGGARFEITGLER